MTQQKETIDLTPTQLNSLFHDVVDLISRHGCLTGSVLHEENGDQAIELAAVPFDDDQELEVVATVYIRGSRLKELQEGGESNVHSTEL